MYHADSFAGRSRPISEVRVPQQCCFVEYHVAAASSTGSAGLSTVEGSSWLILMKTSFILMKHPVRILSWGNPVDHGIVNPRKNPVGALCTCDKPVAVVQLLFCSSSYCIYFFLKLILRVQLHSVHSGCGLYLRADSV